MLQRLPFKFWQNPPYPHYLIEVQPSLPGFLYHSIGDGEQSPVFTGHLYKVDAPGALPRYERSLDFFLPSGWGDDMPKAISRIPATLEE